MSTKTMPGPFDGMMKAAPDEPVFTLRAHDPLAPILVHDWVDRRRKAIRERHANGEITDAKRDLELIQCREADELAWSMEAWRKGEHADAAAQIEKAEKAQESYSGVTLGEDELRAREQYHAIKRAGTLLSNAVAGIHEASEEVLSGLGMEHERAALMACKDRVRAVADHIAPKRASYHAGQTLPPPISLRPLTLSSGEFNRRVSEMREADQ